MLNNLESTGEKMPSELETPGTLEAPHADLRRVVFRVYDRGIELVILGVIPLMLIALAFAFIEAVIGTLHMFPLIHALAPDDTMSPDEIALRELVARVLDVIILIELFNTFMEYARTRHIRISNILDVTIVFALREILIKLYAQVFSSTDLLALCVVVIVLVVARGVTMGFSTDRETKKSSRKT
jgi:uncharacterized membrane protein (DUF373 family)